MEFLRDLMIMALVIITCAIGLRFLILLMAEHPCQRTWYTRECDIGSNGRCKYCGHKR